MMALITSPKKENCNSFNFLSSLLIVIFCFSFTESYSQKATSLDQYIKEEGDNNTGFLKSLVFDNVPTIIIKDSKTQIVGEEFSQKVSTDISSIPTLGSENNNFRTIKLLQVNLGNDSEKSALRITPENLKGFSNLAYIFINSDIPLTSVEVERMVTGFEEGDVILLYQVNSNF
jgi:hypothetical protein